MFAFSLSVFRRSLLMTVALAVLSVLISVLLRLVLGLEISSRTVMIRLLATALAIAPGAVLLFARIEALKRAYRQMLDRARALAAEAAADPLTGLLNRRSFIEQLENALACRGGGQFLLADIDNLKPINDRLGHLAGDEAIEAAALALSEVLGPEALVARVGGDEFCAFMPAMRDPEAGLAARINLRASGIFETRCPQADLPLRLSVALTPARAGMRYKELLRAADEQLYREKDRARRR